MPDSSVPQTQPQHKTRAYSNLIFPSNQKVHPSRNGASPCSKRTNSILLLRSSTANPNKPTRYASPSGFSNEQVLQVNHSQKLNIINLLKGNNAMGVRLKSHYCKKITLSNLDKYYEHCVKAVRSGVSNSMDCRPGELQNIL